MKRLIPIILLSILFSTSLLAKSDTAVPKAEESKLIHSSWNTISTLSDGHDGLILKSLLVVDKEYDFQQISGSFNELAWVEPSKLEYKAWHTWVWQSILIENQSDQTLTMPLVLNRPFTVPTEMFYISDGELIHSRFTDYDDEHFINYIYPTFQVSLTPGKNTIFFNYLGTKKNPDAVLYSPKSFAEIGYLKLGIMLIILGMVILMAVYNLAIYLNERGVEYIYYLLYLVATFWVSVELSGIGRFFSHSEYIHMTPQLFALTPTFLCLFYLSMFDWKQNRPVIYKQVLLGISVGVLYTLFVAIAPFEMKFLTFEFYLPFMFYISIVGLYGLYQETRNGSKQASLMFIGLVTLMVGVVLSFLGTYGFMEEVFLYAPALSFVSQITLFSFALSLRRREELVAEVIANKHSYGQLAKVFYPHQLSQMKAGRNLEETMPEGNAEACVIAFDVAGSSTIKDPKLGEFLHNVLKHCELEMVANYDPENLSSDAYRIKEMGDGFLCSIGFPFSAYGYPNSAEAAWNLAIRFVKAFQEEEAKFGYHETIYCGLGIALDQIEGYFPSSGTRQYDLYGRSIVLATRYESYRKMLFEQIDESGSVIIVQERVYQQLPKDQQDNLRMFNLKESKFKIRDDYGAEKLYYRVMP